MSTPGPTLSVAMATYNGQTYLDEQLASLLAQDRLPDELVVSDDGSTDGTPQILEEFAREAPFPVHVHRNVTNLGWRSNFMATAARCTSDLVAFCDQDDVWHSDKLARMHKVMVDPSVSMAFHNARFIDALGKPLGWLFGPPSGSETRTARLAGDMWAQTLGFSMVFRRELVLFNTSWLSSVDKIDLGENAAHDQWFQFLASILGETAYVDEGLVSYRLHGANNMGYRHERWTLEDLQWTWKQSHKKLLDRAGLVANRIAFLEAAVGSRPDLHHELTEALAAYRAHQSVTQRRLLLYGAALPARARLVASLWGDGAYRSEVLPLARRELYRDLSVAVLGQD